MNVASNLVNRLVVQGFDRWVDLDNWLIGKLRSNIRNEKEEPIIPWLYHGYTFVVAEGNEHHGNLLVAMVGW